MRKIYFLATFSWLQIMALSNVFAQLGSGWVQIENPPVKVHLANPSESLQTYDKAGYVERGDVNGLYASYTFDEATKTETFRLYGARSNRAEIRISENYGKVSRQLQGYLTISDPIFDQCNTQIWGSEDGATQMMLRGRSSNNGSFGVNQAYQSGSPTVMTNVYDKEVKVNIIHFQTPGTTTSGDSIYVYLNDVLKFKFPDTETPTNTSPVGTNYMKYGVYGTVPAGETRLITVKWRDVKYFKDGQPALSQTIAFSPLSQKTIGDADFDPGAKASSALPVSYKSSNSAVATIVDGKIHITGAGTAVISASQGGSQTIAVAAEVSQTLTVVKKNQTISFIPLTAKKEGDADFDPGATATSGLPVTYTSSNPSVATIVDKKIHIVSKGTSIITAQQAGNESFNAAPNITSQLTITSATPIIPIKNNQALWLQLSGQDLTISFALSKGVQAKIFMVNTIGQVVKTISNAYYDKGVHSINLNTGSERKGLYFIKLIAGQDVKICKLLIN